jgi:hypothetical protein
MFRTTCKLKEFRPILNHLTGKVCEKNHKIYKYRNRIFQLGNASRRSIRIFAASALRYVSSQHGNDDEIALRNKAFLSLLLVCTGRDLYSNRCRRCFVGMSLSLTIICE